MSKAHPILKPCFTKERWNELANRTKLSDELGREIDQWNRGLRFSYNCHTLSIGEPLGMQADEWLEGSSSVFTLMNNPVQSLLDAHYCKLRSNLDLGDLPTMQFDDVLVFRDNKSGDLVHSGRIRFANGQMYLLSKLGEYPAATIPLSIVAHEYQGQYDSVDLYRLSVGR